MWSCLPLLFCTTVVSGLNVEAHRSQPQVHISPVSRDGPDSPDVKINLQFEIFNKNSRPLHVTVTSDDEGDVVSHAHPTRGNAVQYFNLTQPELDKLELQVNGSAELFDFDKQDDRSRLAGGTDVAAISSYPYVVYLSINAGLASAKGCTGAILSPIYVITAASCVYNAATIAVHAGAIDDSSTAIAGSGIVHPKYESNTLLHDIALVRLTTALTFSGSIDYISLANKFNVHDHHSLSGKTARVFGFGDTPAAAGEPILRFTRMTGMSYYQCSKAMRANSFKPASSQSCLDTENGAVGMCKQSDVGGPVTYKFKDDSKYTLVGVMSYYEACSSSIPNLFTRIGPYLDLIERYVPRFVNQG